MDGTVTVDDVPPDQIQLWAEKDADMTTCSPKVKQLLLTCETSNDMYLKLQQTFERDSDLQKCLLMEKFYASSWNKTKTVIENVSEIQNLAHQSNSLDQYMSEIDIVTTIR